MNAAIPGIVYLIGAGPGDPGLLTVRGAELISRADVILFDGLVNEALLDYARPDAEMICVGKHGHGGMWSQSQIDGEIVRFAKMGKSVARLKGGDTAIFARTAEEVDTLIDEAIPYEIVPGITAALAASAYTGIPLTHRDWSSSVALITGQLQQTDGSCDAEDSLDWKALAHFPGTLVIYMGVTSAASWSKKLIEAGKSLTTPVALIRRCSWPDQMVIRCELGTVAATIASTPTLRPPIISIVGEVIQLAKTMDWFSKRPWFGKCVWITSPTHTGKLLSNRFEELGAQTIQSPVITIEPPENWQPIDEKLKALDRYNTIVFSSVYGVDAFFGRLHHLGKDGRCMHGLCLAAVGGGTASAIAKHSMHCDIVPQVAGAKSLADLLLPQCEGKRFLFVRNPDGETMAMDRLASSKARVDSLDVYRQSPVLKLPEQVSNLVQSNQLHAITATSKNIAKQAVALLGQTAMDQNWLSLSPSISDCLRSLGCKNVLTANQPSFDDLVALHS
jgi:uroporphyrinogen III methyltransferase/synthase